MKTSKKIWLAVGLFVAVVLASFMLFQFLKVEKAHSTFENYYTFRGCTKLIDKTATYADCQLASGQTIRLVDFRDRWYLDGDLPACFSNACF